MENLQMIMEKMLGDFFYQRMGEANDIMCDVCRAILNDDYYKAVHILDEAVRRTQPGGMFIQEWRLRLHRDLVELSKAVSAVFVARMEATYGVY